MASDFAAALLRWHAQHGRHDLPWQQPRSAYRVWVSEIMLQQTRVETVLAYFQRFMQRFPDVAALAQASLDDVLAHWSGLGYYARARNLHRAAQQIHKQYADEFPRDVAALEALPGVGRSTAAAIASLAFDLPRAILDGNVKRVFARQIALSDWPGTTANLKRLWQVAETHMPTTQCAAYTQAIMDLGATLCTPRNPRCSACPVVASCQAKQQGLEQDIPAPKPRKTLPVRSCLMAITQNPANEVWLEQRPGSGIWGGLWTLPQFASIDEFFAWAPSKVAEDADTLERTPDSLRHTFSHFHLDIEPRHVRLSSTADRTPELTNEAIKGAWYTPAQCMALGLPAPVRRLLEQQFPIHD
jgi:A/G-specific adenine glycosylase